MSSHSRTMRAAVYTLGCKLNQCESEALASSFDSRGFLIGSVRDDAEIYIINTCTVTSKAEQKARRVIRKLSLEHPESAIVVTGCYAQLNREDLVLGANVIVVPHDYKDDISRLPEHLEAFIQGDSSALPGSIPETVKTFFNTIPLSVKVKDRTEISDGAGVAVTETLKSESASSGTPEASSDPDRFWYDSVDFNYHTRAFLKIQDGCDNSCAYCRVTIARGDSVSLDVDLVIKQFKALIERGYREIVLTGVNLTSYNSQGVDFTGLLEKLIPIAEASDGCAGRDSAAPGKAFNTRIRLSSIEPETIDQRMAEALSSPAICPHFHISVQSGSNNILSLMRRHYNREKVIEAVKLLRSVKDDPFFAADVIAGFPGETDEDFELSRSLLDDCDFTHLHVFPFSSRPGTLAASMKHPVPERIAGERTAILRQLSESNSRKYLERWKGRAIDVLLEEQNGKNWLGTSGNYIKAEVCDIINNEGGICRALVESESTGIVSCRFIKWL